MHTTVQGILSTGVTQSYRAQRPATLLWGMTPRWGGNATAQAHRDRLPKDAKRSYQGHERALLRRLQQIKLQANEKKAL